MIQIGNSMMALHPAQRCQNPLCCAVFGGADGEPSAKLYETAVAPLVGGLFDGTSATVWAYGQTGEIYQTMFCFSSFSLSYLLNTLLLMILPNFVHKFKSIACHALVAELEGFQNALCRSKS